ncbi:leucine-rich repeat-containing protein 46-like [Styela clava]
MSNHTLDIVGLVVRRNLKTLKIENDTDVDALVEKLSDLTHVRLDRERLTSVPLLDFLPCITNLYLQCNHIQEMVNFSILINLRFLTLAENRINEVKGVKDLANLGFLDLSDNCIENLVTEQLPNSLIILNLTGNRCIEASHHVGSICDKLPNLKFLNEKSVDCSISSDEDESDDEEELSDDEEESQNEKPKNIDEDTHNKPAFYDKLTTEITESLHKFSTAIGNGEVKLKDDFDYFTSIPESPIPDKNVGFSEQEIRQLEKDTRITRADLPSIKSPIRKISPHPPSGKRIGNTNPRSRTNSAKESQKPIARVRTPGARPFKRVVN